VCTTGGRLEPFSWAVHMHRESDQGEFQRIGKTPDERVILWGGRWLGGRLVFFWRRTGVVSLAVSRRVVTPLHWHTPPPVLANGE